MCKFFSFVTNPDNTSDFYYFDAKQRAEDPFDPFGADSHSHICAYYKINKDKCNKYEYSPLTRKIFVDTQNARIDDRARAERWVKSLDFKTIVEKMIIKPIISPLTLPAVDLPTEEQIGWLNEWRSTRERVGVEKELMIYTVVGSAVAEVVGAELWASVWDAVWNLACGKAESAIQARIKGEFFSTICASTVCRSIIDASVAYASSFFDVDYGYDFSAAVKLFESGLVPAYGGDVWLLYSGTEARSVYELR